MEVRGGVGVIVRVVVGIGRGRGSSRYKGRSRVHKGMQVSHLPLHTLTIRVPSFPMWL